MSKRTERIIDEMIERTSPMTKQAWSDAAQLGIDNDITLADMNHYVDSVAPYNYDETDWVYRAETFEVLLALMSSMREVEKGLL